MDVIETISVIGGIVTLLALLGVIVTFMLPMAANFGNTSYPMTEVGSTAIVATVMVLIPSGFFGWMFFAADGLSSG